MDCLSRLFARVYDFQIFSDCVHKSLGHEHRLGTRQGQFASTWERSNRMLAKWSMSDIEINLDNEDGYWMVKKLMSTWIMKVYDMSGWLRKVFFFGVFCFYWFKLYYFLFSRISRTEFAMCWPSVSFHTHTHMGVSKNNGTPKSSICS